MTHSYYAFIDESGDDGLAGFRQPGRNGGASRWLVISACVIRASRAVEAVEWRDDAIRRCQRTGRDLHFHQLRHEQKKLVCRSLATRQLRFCAVIGKKDSPDAAIFTEKNQLYWYLTRYLIERLSWLCRDYRSRVREGDGRVKITFSRRGGMKYTDFQSYLTRLRGSETSIHWPVIDIDGVTASYASELASLQLADCGARAVAEALEPNFYGDVEGAYLRCLKAVLFSRRENYLSYGLKLLPSLDKAALNEQQLEAISPFV